MDHTQLKMAVFDEIRKEFPEFADTPFDQLNERVFYHKDEIRLTYSGFLIIKKIFTAYSFDISTELKVRHYKNMSKLMYPFFVTSNRLVLFSSADAMAVKFCDSVERFLEF